MAFLACKTDSEVFMAGFVFSRVDTPVAELVDIEQLWVGVCKSACNEEFSRSQVDSAEPELDLERLKGGASETTACVRFVFSRMDTPVAALLHAGLYGCVC